MARKKISEELQEAILSMPVKERNKLLIRLVNKDEILVDQLQFKLLEGTPQDLEFRRQAIKEKIDQVFATEIYNMDSLLRQTKGVVTSINRHVKVTKDKLGELETLLYLFLKANQRFPTLYKFSTYRRPLADKYRDFADLKFKKVQKLFEEVHEDYRIEFEDNVDSFREFLDN